MPLPQVVTAGLITKSDKIRALARAGFSRVEIASHLKIRYQHVRKVLVDAGLGNAGLGSIRGAALPTPTMPIRRPSWTCEQLAEGGFQILGEWRLSDEGGLMLSATAPIQAGVYAFALDGIVAYVGLTQSGVRARLGQYIYGYAGQRTNARVKQLLVQALQAGSRVDVLIAAPPALEWNGLPVDGAAGLEAGLIRAICPIWNMLGARAGGVAE